uniref:Uncharacterized protein n=1 Tax=viral metagenome TaxID=1070528 RepID=A0A6C0IXK7_9ZZZZ
MLDSLSRSARVYNLPLVPGGFEGVILEKTFQKSGSKFSTQKKFSPQKNFPQKNFP